MLQKPTLRHGNHRDGGCDDDGDDDGKTWQQEGQRLWQWQVNDCENMAMTLAMTVAMPQNLFLKNNEKQNLFLENRVYFWKIAFIFGK